MGRYNLLNHQPVHESGHDGHSQLERLQRNLR
jgi:hypothetical protein